MKTVALIYCIKTLPAIQDSGGSSPSSSFNATSSFISHGPGGPPGPSGRPRPGGGSGGGVSRRPHAGWRLTPEELRQLWRSAGCDTHEITLT